jgi:hypothetical protein
MWFRSDDKGWCHELKICAFWIGAGSEIMLLWPNLKCYVDWKWCYRKISRPIGSNIWIRTNDRGWCHDVILGDMWIGTDDKRCSHDQIGCAMRIGKNLTGSFNDKFEVLCGI